MEYLIKKSNKKILKNIFTNQFCKYFYENIFSYLREYIYKFLIKFTSTLWNNDQLKKGIILLNFAKFLNKIGFLLCFIKKFSKI